MTKLRSVSEGTMQSGDEIPGNLALSVNQGGEDTVLSLLYDLQNAKEKRSHTRGGRIRVMILTLRL